MTKFKTLTKAQKRDFDYYVSKSNNRVPSLLKPNTIQEAHTLEEWFWLWDTHGIIAKYHDWNMCGSLVQAKANLNLTIKLWIEDIANESYTLYPREVWEWCNDFPPWVWKSFAHQLATRHLPFKWQNVYLAPDNYTYWPYTYLWFDPSI